MGDYVKTAFIVLLFVSGGLIAISILNYTSPTTGNAITGDPNKECKAPTTVSDFGTYQSNIVIAATSEANAKKLFEGKGKHASKISACNAKTSLQNTLSTKCTEYCTTGGT